MVRLRRNLTTLAAAFAGAMLLHWAGVPAGALLGATLATVLAGLLGAGPDVPDPLRNTAFAVIGVSLGAGMTDHLLSDLARWPVSLIGLTVTMLAIMLVSSLLLVRVFRLDPDTAALSSSPGALSYAVAMAAEGRGDLDAVIVLQSLRLLLVTLCLPPVIAALAGVPDPSAIGGAGQVGMTGPVALLLVVLAMATGLGTSRLGLPAPHFLAGLLISGGAHGLGWVGGGLPAPVVFAGFAVTGAVIGSRFGGLSHASIARLARAGLVVTGVSVLISAVGAWGVAALTGIPFTTVWVAFAPGGVEGMAAIGLALGLDPAYVATHHIFRIMLLILVLPFAVRLAR
jgi:membrane AbrB-like protein